MKIVSPKERTEDSNYAPDYRLQLVAVEDAPRLKVSFTRYPSFRRKIEKRLSLHFASQVYFKNSPTEMLCGEVSEITVLLENVGNLPVNRVLFGSSENGLFAVPSSKSKNDVFILPCGVIEPGCSKEVAIFIRACDTSGRISVDLLFYYDSDQSSQHRNLKYRLIYHTMHVLIHESLLFSVSAVRSLMISGEGDEENVNFKVQAENKNQVSEKYFIVRSAMLSSSKRIRFVFFNRCTIRIKLL